MGLPAEPTGGRTAPPGPRLRREPLGPHGAQPSGPGLLPGQLGADRAAAGAGRPHRAHGHERRAAPGPRHRLPEHQRRAVLPPQGGQAGARDVGHGGGQARNDVSAPPCPDPGGLARRERKSNRERAYTRLTHADKDTGFHSNAPPPPHFSRSLRCSINPKQPKVFRVKFSLREIGRIFFH